MIGHGFIQMGSSQLLAASSATHSQLFVGAADQLTQLVTRANTVEVDTVLPPLRHLVQGLEQMNMPLDIVTAANNIRESIEEIRQQNPAASISAYALVGELNEHELLPRPDETPQDAIDRLFQDRQTRNNMPALALHRNRITQSFARTGRFHPIASIQYRQAPAGTHITELEAPPVLETNIEEEAVVANDNAQQATRDNPVPFHIKGREELQYYITGILGEGAGGIVYEAYDVRIGRYVAIKLISDLKGMGDKEKKLEMFRNEAHLQGTVRHHRIVEVFDMGEDQTGQPFAVMQLMHNNLQSLLLKQLNDGHFKLEQRMNLAEQAVAAVAKAHALGIVHKDIKPENFFLNEHADGQITVHLGDFGIAQKKTAIDADSAAGITKQVRGTPIYMAASDFFDHVPDDYTRDVYALGTLIYELLTDDLPYDCDGDYIKICYIKNENDPEAPSRMARGRGIPSSVDRIILKALARDPSERQANAEELLFELVTYRAQAHEEHADTLRKSISALVEQDERNMEFINDTMDEWRAALAQALTEYKKSYVLYKLPSTKEKLVSIHYQLIRLANRQGNEGERRRLIEELKLIEPDAPQIEKLEQPISVQIQYDEGVIDDGRFLVQLRRSTDNRGILEFEDESITLKLPTSFTDLERGSAYSIGLTHPEFHPVNIPLPVRHSALPHRVRIPLYRRGTVPKDWLIIPAGPVAVREFSGRFSERVEAHDWREIPYDYAIGPKVTNAQYIEFLMAIRSFIETRLVRDRDNYETEKQRFAQQIPAHWHSDIHERLLDTSLRTHMDLLDNNGMSLEKNGAVTGVSYKNAVAFLKWKYRNKNVLPADLDEWKKAMRGIDRRTYPWGDNTRRGIALWRFAGWHSLLRVPDNNYEGEFSHPRHRMSLGDISPYSIFDGFNLVQGIRFLVSGTQTLLRLSEATAQRVLDASDLQVDASQADQLSSWVFVAGEPYDAPVPTNVDIVQPVSVHNRSALEKVGFFPVQRLKEAQNGVTPTPRISTLTR